MVSPELIRRYPFFAGLKHEHIAALADAAVEQAVNADHIFFREGETLEQFFFLLEGAVAIVIELPDNNEKQPVSGQLLGTFHNKDVVVSTVGPGEVFGWSGLVPPPMTTAKAKALTTCRVLVFDCPPLLQAFSQDCEFGYLMMQRAARVIRNRLHDMHIQSLASIAS